METAGGIGLLVSRLAGPAVVGLIGLMASAALTQLVVLSPAWTVLPVAFAVVLSLIARVRMPRAALIGHGFRD